MKWQLNLALCHEHEEDYSKTRRKHSRFFFPLVHVHLFVLPLCYASALKFGAVKFLAKGEL